MIPKIIHFCWFGGKELPESVVRCINSWKKCCPEYEIKRWDESNFDVNSCEYSKEAYKAGKWAFVSDYARCCILYEYGGLYFDTDVELIAPIEKIREEGPFVGLDRIFIGKNIEYVIALGLGIGASPHMKFLADMKEEYEHSDYNDSVTIVHRAMALFTKCGLQNKNEFQEVYGFHVYPTEYFGSQNNKTGKLELTDNTVSIHHYDASWVTDKERYTMDLQKKLMKALSYKISGHMAAVIATLKYDGLEKTIAEVKKKIVE